MRRYGFAAMRPPQTGWDVGSVVELVDGVRPTLRITPALAGITVATIKGEVPEVRESGRGDMELSAGISLPSSVRLALSGQGARTYSVEIDESEIVILPVDPYISGPFKDLAKAAKGQWKRALDAGTLRYVRELWCCKRLRYKFFDEKGQRLSFSGKTDGLAAELSEKATWGSDGTLTYEAKTGGQLLCIGYKLERVYREDVAAQAATGDVTALPPEAKIALWELPR